MTKMLCCLLTCVVFTELKLLSSVQGFVLPLSVSSSPRHMRNRTPNPGCVHSLTTSIGTAATETTDSGTIRDEQGQEEPTSLWEVCRGLGVTSSLDLLALSDDVDDDVVGVRSRGVVVTRDVPDGAVLLSVPLSSCLRDDDPPPWLPNNYDLSWETRLAASLLDLQDDRARADHDDDDDLRAAHRRWLALQPHPSVLRASLPVHWSDATLSRARSCALESAVDRARVARAEAMETLGTAHPRRRCDDALDRVALGARKVPGLHGLYPASRVLCPVLDSVRHGTSGRTANVVVTLEEEGESVVHVVVRTTAPVARHEEILCDYGDGARPAWKCLANYGFVPRDDNGKDDATAEVFLHGIRYEVGPESVPAEMVVEAATAEGGDEDGLTAAVALRLAGRLRDVAYDLLLVESDDSDDEDELRASSLAAALRFSQHRILATCASNLEEHAVRSLGLDAYD